MLPVFPLGKMAGLKKEHTSVFFAFCFLKIFPLESTRPLFFCNCIGSSLLCTGFLSSCSEQGLLFVAVHGLLIVVASLVAEHRL